MAKPLPPLTIPPAAASKATTLSYKQLRALWIQAGGNPAIASTMAAVALAESGGKISALNNNPKTGDYSVGPWQINYFGDMRAGRTAKFGSPEKLQSDPLANARAAVALAGDGSGFGNWTTYTSGAYKAFLTPQTPAEKAAQAAADARAQAASPEYVAATTDISVIKSQAVAAAKATAHISDPWIVKVVKNGNVVGFTESTGANPPKNAVMVGGLPVTKSEFQNKWSYTYDQEFQHFTGRTATPAEQAKIIERGVSVYALTEELSKSKGFMSSPAYKTEGAGVIGKGKATLGVAPPPEFVRQAIVQNWNDATLQEKLRELPQYEKGPEYKNAKASIQTVYEKIYGNPAAHRDGGKQANAWIKQAALNGWSQDAAAQAFRANPAYKFSPEYEAKATNFLDAMGLFIGSRPVLTPTKATGTGALQPALPLSPHLAGAGNLAKTPGGIGG